MREDEENLERPRKEIGLEERIRSCYSEREAVGAAR